MTDAAADPAELPFGGTLGRFLILEVLGHGGMGIVYAAYDPVLDRRIALKLLRGLGDEGTEGRTRMQREAQALARLSHPNVITVHDVHELDGTMAIAMELVPGSTLAVWQEAKPWREIVAVYASAGRGLAAAHAAGLVHRDFKPDNVLVGRDGRVRVTDFGLARLATSTEAAPIAASPTSQLASTLTVAGTVMGTPRYMAPEQIDGGVVDARSDQYAWCVALWEALYGEQPFPTAPLSLRCAAMKTEVPRAPAASAVPRAIGRVLARGLAPEPADRWPSVDALVDELQRVTTPRRRWLAGAGIAAMAAAIVLFVVASRRDRPAAAPSCEASGEAIAAVWSDDAQRAVHDAFLATRAPFASDALVSLARAIGGWRDRWRTQALESCRATRISGTQSAAVMELRSACLARRRDELRTMLAALAHADRALVENARTLVLPDLDTCSDVAVLAGTTPPPADPAKHAERTALEAELATIEGELVLGMALERARGLEQPATALVARARALGWPPLLARARQAEAGVQRELGRGKDARVTLVAAAAAASAANDADRLVEIYTELIDVEGRLTSDYALGDGWATLAEGTLARLGPRPEKQLRVLRRRARVAQKAGRLDDARAIHEAALALARVKGPNEELGVLAELGLVAAELGELDVAAAHLERAHAMAVAELGPNHPKLASIEHDLGTVAYRHARYAEAEARFRAALAIREAAFATDTDDVGLATTIEALGIALLAQGRIDDAQPHLVRALELLEQRLGADHPDVANALNDIGGAYHKAGDYRRELETGRRALAIRERALGPDHPDVAQSLVNVAIASKALGDWTPVIPNYLRAIRIFEKAFGAAHVNTAITRLNFAEALRVQRKLDDAAREYERARAVFEAQFGADHPLLGHVWNGVGQLELARGRTAEAVAILGRAVALRERDPGDATALAESRFALARALGKGDPKARPLATQAREAYAKAGAAFASQLADIDAWLR